jgi:type IV pilus biogenesis protein CpaD/CtpE
MARIRGFPQRVAAAAAALAAAAACTQTPARPAGTDRIKPAYNEKTGQLERITYDRNGDGKIDATTFMSGTAVVRAELDEDFDGVIDRWEHYAKGSTSSPNAAEATTRVLEKVESTTRSDGKITRREMYEGGVRRAVEEDSDSDGRVDKWETWEGGALRVVAVDTHGRGKPDRRFVYPADGQAPRLEVDESGTGRFTPVTDKQ